MSRSTELEEARIKAKAELDRATHIAQLKRDQALDAIKLQQKMGINLSKTYNGSTQVIQHNTIEIDVYEMLEHCGDLLATGVITPPEWMKLKKLLRSNNEEDINLVKGILDAKVEIK